VDVGKIFFALSNKKSINAFTNICISSFPLKTCLFRVVQKQKFPNNSLIHGETHPMLYLN
jgi:hypothetical protein